MSKRKKRVFTLLIAVMLIASCACVYASVKTSQGVNNIVKTGGINIDVNTYQTNTDGEIIPLNDTTVVDYYGETEYIPVITNKAEDCYIRLKVNADTETQEINIIENLKGVNDNFKMIDGYLYYTEPLEKDESIELCKSFDVPDEWDYMTSNNLKIQVKVDAIQAKNFYPNFKSSAPWGDVEIYKSNIADDYEVNTAGEVEEEENIKIVYLNHVDGININSDDFFKNITFMPGDKYIDTLTVENNTDEDAKILFKTEYKETPLLNTMDLAIDNGDIFYSGKLASKELTEYKEIADLSPGEKSEINVQLSIPAETGNDYQAKSDEVTWHFAVAQDVNSIPQTGESILLFVVAFVLAFIAGTLGALCVRGKKHENL